MAKKDLYHDESMFKGAPNSAYEKAKLLRENMTQAEKRLWSYLKNKQLKGYKFRRQHPLHLFIVDFYFHELGLVIEVDGDYHSEKEQMDKDEKRTELINFQGIKVIRFTNKEVMENINEVINQIKDEIDNSFL